MGGLVSDFKALTPKQWLGIIVAIALALILAIYMGTQCLGFLIVAIVLYMIPHLLKVTSVKVKTVVGVVFIIVAILVGTFAFTGTANAMENEIDVDGEHIRDITYDQTTDTLEFYVLPDQDSNDWEVKVRYVPIESIPFGMYPLSSQNNLVERTAEQSEMTAMSDNWYRVTLSGLGFNEGNYYQVVIGILNNKTGENQEVTQSVVEQHGFWYNDGADTTMLTFIGTVYNIAYSSILFFMILVFSAMMRSSAEKTRAKMEAEGRLYPQGYGRCKQCGAMVLPGEVNCRKCGAYIDVPDELRVKKKDFFQCSECGAEVPSDATECPKCGAKFDEAQENVVVHADGSEDVSTENVVCPECGSTVPSNADWCPKCGKMLKDYKQ